MNNKNRLNLKMISFCIIFASTLSMLIGGLGYYTYSKNVKERYQVYVDTIVQLCFNKVDGDELEKCIKNGIEDESYTFMQENLNAIKENSEIQYIYMVYFNDDKELFYGMNAYTQEEMLNEQDTISHLGDKCGEYDFDQEMVELFKKSIFETNSDLIIHKNNITEANDSEAGIKEYVLTGYKVVKNSQGENVCILAVDISMTKIYDNLNTYLATVLVGTIIVVLVFIIFSITIVTKQIINPISKIADVANNFVEQSYSISSPSDFNVQEIKIKNKDEIQDLGNSVNHMIKEIVKYMEDLSSMAANEERIAVQVGIVSQIKNNLLPHIYPAFPERDDFSIYATINIAKEAKGNFYDYFFTDKSHMCIVMGDVSGSGIPTTMFSVIASTHIKNYAKLQYSPSRILFETNNQLSSNNDAGLSVNLFLCIIDLENGDMEYSCAGKSNVLIKRSGLDFVNINSTKCFEIATMENVQYSQQKISLMQGDTLFIYTDGLGKVVDSRGNIFSDENILECLNTIVTREYNVEKIVKEINSSVDTFRKGCVQEDENSMLMFRYM